MYIDPDTRAEDRLVIGQGPAARQYFKFGPYRNHPGYDSYAMLARYTRALHREDIR